MCVNSTSGSNQGNIDHLAQIESATAQIKNDSEEALQKLLTTNTSPPTAPYVPISLAQYKQQKKTRFHKLAIECRVAQVAIDKGVKVYSQDGTVYSEFLAQVRSQPTVWRDVQLAQKSLPQDVSKSIEAMFSGAGKKLKEGFFESVEAMTVFAGTSFEQEAADSSKSIEPIPVFEGTDSEKVITLASGTI